MWEPLRYGFQVKLRGYGGKFLSASGGTLRWSNRVTHDSPYSTTTHNWILWNIEPVDVPEDESLTDYLTMVSNFSSVSDELSTLDLGSPMSMHSSLSFSPKVILVFLMLFLLVITTSFIMFELRAFQTVSLPSRDSVCVHFTTLSDPTYGILMIMSL